MIPNAGKSSVPLKGIPKLSAWQPAAPAAASSSLQNLECPVQSRAVLTTPSTFVAPTYGGHSFSSIGRRLDGSNFRRAATDKGPKHQPAKDSTEIDLKTSCGKENQTRAAGTSSGSKKCFRARSSQTLSNQVTRTAFVDCIMVYSP